MNKGLLRRARILGNILAVILLLQTAACAWLEDAPVEISASQIRVEYPNGMTVNNGQTLRVYLVNRSIHCVDFTIKGSFPVFIYMPDGTALQVQNKRTYINPIIRLNLTGTVSARRFIEVTPFLDRLEGTYNQVLFKAYILLEGAVCDSPEARVTKKIPFFIQYYMDY